MRVIAGQFRGIQLVAPVGEVARPTTDRVKESMFNLMGITWQGNVAVDLFAGSGALGIEALSRGASAAILVDRNHKSISAIRDNVRRMRQGDNISVWQMDWKAAWRKIEEMMTSVGWVFLDPPYALSLWAAVLEVVGNSAVVVEHGVVCECPRSQTLPEQVGRLTQYKRRAYGDIAIVLYKSVDPCQRGDL